jgi:HK97 family phage major capsid protein
MMRTRKEILEAIDDAAHAARAIDERAMSDGRDWTAAEENEFLRWNKTIDRLEDELKIVTKQQEQIRGAKTMTHQPYVSDQTDRPQRVLPINGKLPREDHASYDRIRVRPARLKCFKSEREAFDSGMWLRSIASRLYGREDRAADAHCQRVGFDITHASYEGSGTSGGYLTPAPLSQAIIDVRENVGIARRVCQIQPMSSDTLSVPKRSGGLTVYYPNELQTITDSDKTWSQISLVAEKRAVASKISQELIDDALISIVDNVVSEMAYALALREDAELLNGDATSSYGHVQGLRNAIGSAGVYTCDANENLWSEIDLEDVFATMTKLPDRFNRNPVWICSSNFYFAVFARLLGAAGGTMLGELQAGAAGIKQFFGVPVLTSSQMPTVDADSTIHALFGQFDMAVVLGDRTGIRIGRDDSTGFLADYTTLKATSRYDIKVHEPGDSSNAGAYVALKTNAA